MSTEVIEVLIRTDLIGKVDSLVREKVFASRSDAINSAIKDMVRLYRKKNLALECAKLDKKEERRWAEDFR